MDQNMDNSINLEDLLLCDAFRSIQSYLSLADLFALRCVSSGFRKYIDRELRFIKQLRQPNANKSFVNPLKHLASICCNLKEINLQKNNWLTDDLLIKLLENNKKSLITVSLSNCTNLTSVSLQPMIIHCKNLKKLQLYNCNFLSQGCLESIAFHQENIEELDLGNCSTMSERCLLILISKMKRLRVLSLASTSNVCDNVLFSISRCLKDIVHLNLFGCYLITDRGVGALSLNCKKLETLSIRGCNLLTERSLDLMRNRNIHIDIPKRTTNVFNQHNYLYLPV